MIRSEVVGLDERARWDAALAEWPDGARDVYFSSGYHAAFVVGQHAEGHLFVARDGARRMAYPFLLRPVDRVGDMRVPPGHRDIEGVYGFSGPLAEPADPAFLADAWSAFGEWARGRGVVAEFVRFNPLLGNERFAPEQMTLEAVREHVVLDLRPSEEAIWRGYSKTNRNMIRKASKAGVRCRMAPVRELLSEFCALYDETMDRNRAGAGYYFGRQHFAALADAVPSLACAASLDGRVVAVSLFLLAPGWMHYHLSGCGEEGLRVAANNRILHEAVLEARRRGLPQLHFGGGRTGSPSDPLLRFKAGFSRARLPVWVGRRVHDAAAYERLCELRRAQVPDIPAGFFLAYRWEGPARPA